jgi:transcriptional regulator with XRE-family HTH domain
MEVRQRMNDNTYKQEENIYFKHRKEAAKSNDQLNSRAGAAALLGLSVSSLSDYELGLTKVVPVDKVLLMADLYNAPELKSHYCNECCLLGCNNPKIELQNLDRISLKALHSFKKIVDAKETLLNIVEDGVITADEKPDLTAFLTVMEEIEGVAKQMRLWAEKNGML